MRHFTLRGAVRAERHCFSGRRSQGLQACMSVKFNSQETYTHTFRHTDGNGLSVRDNLMQSEFRLPSLKKLKGEQVNL